MDSKREIGGVGIKLIHYWRGTISISYRSLCSFLAHASDIDDLLEGLNGVLKDWLDRLHDTKSSFHIVNLWLHTFNGLHLSGNFDKWLSIIESLKDSSGKGLLDVLDSGGLGNGGITISSSFGSLSGFESWWELGEEFVFTHEVVCVGWGNGGESKEFHFF